MEHAWNTIRFKRRGLKGRAYAILNSL